MEKDIQRKTLEKTRLKKKKNTQWNAHLINFFDEDSTATTQNVVENLDLIRMSKVEDTLRCNLAA